MQSVDERLGVLEADLLANPMRISAYHDLPFTIFCYPPHQEFPFRGRTQLLKTRLENAGKAVTEISMAELMWQGISENMSIDHIAQDEEKWGYAKIEGTINSYLSIPDFSPLSEMVLHQVKDCDPGKHIVFLTRIGAMAPNIYRMSILLNELHGKTMVPIILFYPGAREGEAVLKFMNMQGRNALSGYNYRVKIY